MATGTVPVNLSVVTQDELWRSVKKLAVAAPFHRLKSGFVERFLSRREGHFDHFQTKVIDPGTIFPAQLYNEKPRVTFEQVEIAEVQEYISQGCWAWSASSAQQVSSTKRKQCRHRQLRWLLLLHREIVWWLIRLEVVVQQVCRRTRRF